MNYVLSELCKRVLELPESEKNFIYTNYPEIEFSRTHIKLGRYGEYNRDIFE